MKTNIKKLIGWLLVIAGAAVIFWSAYASYNIFTAKDEAPEIFQQAEEKIEEIVEAEEKIGGIFPARFSSQILNLLAWTIFVIILIFAGWKIANIGIKLMGD